MNPPAPPLPADVIVCESTYGDRLHPEGEPVAAVGEIVRKGTVGRFQGYHDMPEATESKVRDGWYHSGDLGAIREIAGWSLLDVYLTRLFRRGYTLEDLRFLIAPMASKVIGSW